ncbi:MAG: hypothetical protein Q4G08_08705 [Capnocytophaga sp.]|nr:hypothetical protein [Capnocytophaga sp.]
MNVIIRIVLILCAVETVSAQSVTPQLMETVAKAERFNQNGDMEKAVALLDFEIAKHKEMTAPLAYLYAYKSRLYALNDSLSAAQKNAEISYGLTEKTANHTAKAASLLAQMYINNLLDLYDEVIASGKEGLHQAEQDPSDPYTHFLLNYKMYAAYSRWNDTERMKHYAQNSIGIARKAGIYDALANGYNALSSIYIIEYEKNGQQNAIDSSYAYLQKSFDLYKQYPETIMPSTLSVTCNNIANHFLSYTKLPLQEAQNKAFEYLDIAERLSKSPNVLANIYGIKSVFAMRNNKPLQAEKYLNNALSIVKDHSDSDLETYIRIYHSLAEIASAKGDFKTATGYWQEINRLNEKLYDQQQRFNAQKIEVQYELKKKDRELGLLSEQVKLRERQNLLYIGIIISAVLGLVFMFSSYHFRLRYSLEREKIIQSEKEEAELQTKLEKEEKARLKVEQDLMRLHQEQLQKETMATALQVQQKNELIQRIRNTLKEGSPQKVKKLLKEEEKISTEYEEIKMQLQSLHPDFFNRLNETANQKLTALDLRYCAYIYLKMSAKQIAQILHIETQSVRMFKYRLKQKFNVGKESDFDNFIQKEI